MMKSARKNAGGLQVSTRVCTHFLNYNYYIKKSIPINTQLVPAISYISIGVFLNKEGRLSYVLRGF